MLAGSERVPVGPMSELGHSRRSGDVRVTSAHPPRAATKQTSRDFAFVPGTDIPRVSLRRGAKKTSHRYLVSHRLDAGKLNHSRPLLGLFGDKLVEVSWRA